MTKFVAVTPSSKIQVGDTVVRTEDGAVYRVWGVDDDSLALRGKHGRLVVGRSDAYRRVSPADDMTIDQAKTIIRDLYWWVRKLASDPMLPGHYIGLADLRPIADDICRDLIPEADR